MPDFDPVAEARAQLDAHWGDEPVPSMSAVTSIMRVQQILLARLNDELKPFDLTFPRYEALMLLYYSRRGALPLGKMGDRLQVHRTSVTNIIDGLERSGFVGASRTSATGARRWRRSPRAGARSPRRDGRAQRRCTSGPIPLAARGPRRDHGRRSSGCAPTRTASALADASRHR